MRLLVLLLVASSLANALYSDKIALHQEPGGERR
jgi:hypothetical protein